MPLYLDGSESGLRQEQPPLADNYLILIDPSSGGVEVHPVITQKRRSPRANESALNPLPPPSPAPDHHACPTAELNYNALCIMPLCAADGPHPVMWLNSWQRTRRRYMRPRLKGPEIWRPRWKFRLPRRREAAAADSVDGARERW